MYLYVYMYVHVHVYLQACIYLHTFTPTCINVYLCMYVLQVTPAIAGPDLFPAPYNNLPTLMFPYPKKVILNFFFPVSLSLSLFRSVFV